MTNNWKKITLWIFSQLNSNTETNALCCYDMSARRKRVISTDEIQFNHKPGKMLLSEIRESVKIAKPQIQLGSVFQWSQTLPLSRADPVVVFPLCWWCPPQESSQPHPPQLMQQVGIILCMRPANETRCPSLAGRIHKMISQQVQLILQLHTEKQCQTHQTNSVQWVNP